MDMPMSNLRNTPVEVLTSVQRRRRWTPQQKLEIILKTNEPEVILPFSRGIKSRNLMQPWLDAALV